MSANLFLISKPEFGDDNEDFTQNKSSQSAISSKSLSRCSTVEARRLIDQEVCANLGVLPLAILSNLDGKVLTAAVAEDNELEATKALRFRVGYEVRPVLVPRSILLDAIFRAYNGDDRGLMVAARTLKDSYDFAEPKSPARLDIRSSDNASAKFLSTIVDYAIARNASDLHFVPAAQGTQISMRINGVIRRRQEGIATQKQHDELISRIKVLANLNIAEKRLPQDGSFEVELLGNERRAVRVGIMPTIHGERASLRFHGSIELKSISDLELDRRSQTILVGALSKESGLILFSGPTGSGKTTTMYACLKALNQRGLNIITIEDPVEKVLPWASQTSIDRKAGIDYPRALSAALRHDPDAILLGEIRDAESANIALQASLTGHIILSTVHARGAAEVILRLRGLGLPEEDLKQALSLVIYQRLLPKLCSKCRVFDLNSSKLFNKEIYKAGSCSLCEMTGYSGRVLVVGTLANDKCFKTQNKSEKTSFEKSLEASLLQGSISLEQFNAATEQRLVQPTC